MSVVTFQTDVFPYNKGDVVELTADEKARVDEVAKLRNVKAYVAGDKSEKGGGTPSDILNARAAADRKAAKVNAVDQAAQLEAQREAKAEPANVDALGVVAEDSVVVTGTAPVDGVEVVNPQEATDIGSEEGAEVKTSSKK